MQIICESIFNKTRIGIVCARIWSYLSHSKARRHKKNYIASSRLRIEGNLICLVGNGKSTRTPPFNKIGLYISGTWTHIIGLLRYLPTHANKLFKELLQHAPQASSLNSGQNTPSFNASIPRSAQLLSTKYINAIP